MHVAEGPMRVLQAGERHVFNVVLQERLAPGGYLARATVKQIMEDRDVMATQVVQRVHVGAKGTEIGAGSRHVVDSAQRPVGDILPEPNNAGVVQEYVTAHQD